jgi:peptidoglycan hydrolase FlgJ
MEIRPIGLDTARLANSAATDPQALRSVGQIDDPRARAEAMAGQLEGVFMQMMVKSMRSTVPDGGVTGKGLGGDTYVQMLDQALVDQAVSGAEGGPAGPFDAAFHDALVRQIMNDPNASPGASGTFK